MPGDGSRGRAMDWHDRAMDLDSTTAVFVAVIGSGISAFAGLWGVRLSIKHSDKNREIAASRDQFDSAADACQWARGWLENVGSTLDYLAEIEASQSATPDAMTVFLQNSTRLDETLKRLYRLKLGHPNQLVRAHSNRFYIESRSIRAALEHVAQRGSLSSADDYTDVHLLLNSPKRTLAKLEKAVGDSVSAPIERNKMTQRIAQWWRRKFGKNRNGIIKDSYPPITLPKKNKRTGGPRS